jgi:carbonic anhydrase
LPPRSTIPFATLCIADQHAPSYHGGTGPSHWASLESGFGTCGIGHAQSPIDIRSANVETADRPAIGFHYQPAPLKIVDNSHTIQVNYAPGSYIDLGGHRYELVQFHFHKPSEKSIDGKHRDMVAHLVHKDAEGRLAVVAVLLHAGAVNPLVAELWNNLPAHTETEIRRKACRSMLPTCCLPIAATTPLPDRSRLPPCNDGVTWFVLKQPSTLSAAEIARYASAYPMNARPVQPLDGRVVRESRWPGVDDVQC